MKVCFVAHWAGSGGAEKVLYKIVAMCRRHGVEAVCIVPRDGSLVGKVRQLDVPCYTLRYHWWMSKDTPLLKRVARNVLNLFWAVSIARIIRRERCDVVHSNTTTIHVGGLAARLARRPHVWHLHEYGYEHGGMTFDLGLPLSARLMSALSDRIITVSNGIASKYHRFIRRDKFVTLYNPIELPDDIEPEARTVPGTFRIVVVGSLHEGKGQEQAIRATAALVRGGIDCELVVVGDGEDEAYKRRLADLAREGEIVQRVQFRGQLADPYSVMKSADCLVMCSKFEGFSMVIVEAMLLDLAVIAADSGSVSELVDDMVTGLKYEHGNVEQLVEKLKFVHRNRDAAAAMAARARTWADRTFREETFFASLHGVLAGTLSEMAPRGADTATNIGKNSVS